VRPSTYRLAVLLDQAAGSDPDLDPLIVYIGRPTLSPLVSTLGSIGLGFTPMYPEGVVPILG
jgi:hypothetical protein